jgi:cell wall assembly regulator SMI1
MSLASTLRSLQGRRLRDEHGKEHVVELLPPADEAELTRLAASLPGPLPADVREALLVSKGLAKGPLESFSLVDLEGFGLEEAFPSAYSIAHDGSGNYWVLDLLPGAASWGPVFYACHDPPVIAWQAENVERFLIDVIAMWEPGARSPVNLVHQDVVHRIWREPEGVRPVAEVGSSADPLLAEFAASLPDSALVADLRQASAGDGFPWGRFGPRTEIRRAGRAHVWALIPPERKPGFWRRLFGKGGA